MWNEALAQFALRLAFGLALALESVSDRDVRRDFFRVHLYVVMGLAVLAALALFRVGDAGRWLAVASAVAAYVASAIWLYDAPRSGKAAIAVSGSLALLAAWQSARGGFGTSFTPWQDLGLLADIVTSGALMGFTLGAMLLGHFYLNAPGMKLEPLSKLMRLMAGSIAARAVAAGVGLAILCSQAPPDATTWVFLALRWLAGLVGASIVVVMVWQTLKIPNTQSATGILYAGVIVVAIGELVALLAARGHPWPL